MTPHDDFNAVQASVSELAEYLCGMRDAVIHYERPPDGKNNRSYLTMKNPEAVFAKATMQSMRRRLTV